jgi:hypothetical protein
LAWCTCQRGGGKQRPCRRDQRWLCREDNGAAHSVTMPFASPTWVAQVGALEPGCHPCSSSRGDGMVDLTLLIRRFSWDCRSQPVGGFAPRDARLSPLTGVQPAGLFRRVHFEPGQQRQLAGSVSWIDQAPGDRGRLRLQWRSAASLATFLNVLCHPPSQLQLLSTQYRDHAGAQVEIRADKRPGGRLWKDKTRVEISKKSSWVRDRDIGDGVRDNVHQDVQLPGCVEYIG